MRTDARLARAGIGACAALLLGGCATKSDIRNLQQQMMEMQRNQQEALAELQRQNRLLLDSIRATTSATIDTRGNVSNQLRQFDQNVNQLSQLVGQIMGTLGRIESRLTTLEQQRASGGGGATPGGGTAQEYYAASMQRFNSGSYATARAGFMQLVSEFPQHERAPDAQFQIGETYYQEKAFAEAYEELEKVAAQWPDSPAARRALVRAGAIAEEQRDIPRARRYYTRVRDTYRGTDEATHAAARLRALPNR